MGQQPSKKTKKSGKDKDTGGPADGSVEAAGDDTVDEALQDTSSRANTSGNADLNAQTTPSINVSIADETHTSSGTGGSSRGLGSPPSPSPNSRTIPNHSSSASLSTTSSSPPTSPQSGSKQPPAPLDIPITQTILSNPAASPFPQGSAAFSTPGSTGSSFPVGADTMGSAVGNGGGKGGVKSLDIDDMIQRLLDVGYTGKVSKSLCLKNAEIAGICQAAREVFLNQPTLVELSPPVKIVGDVHGQYSDLIRLFEMCGFPPAANYLFLGDYVDRGKQSLETILLLLCYKIKYPENFFLLRGNHECANVTRGE